MLKSSISNTPEALNLFYQPMIPEGIRYLDPDESRHCIKVLRKNPGDAIRITDGKGMFYNAVIVNNDPRKSTFEIHDQQPEFRKTFSIHVAISPTKNADRIEWFVEKVVEFGVDKITLIECKNTERSYLKTERLEKVAVSAMKQSLKATLPVIQALISVDDFVNNAAEKSKFIAYVDHANPLRLQDIAIPGEHYIVLIGPEGDFTQDELALALRSGFKKVSLGKSRLRTETAGIAACHILNLINA